jgi:hypothetical protein
MKSRKNEKKGKKGKKGRKTTEVEYLCKGPEPSHDIAARNQKDILFFYFFEIRMGYVCWLVWC